METKTDLIESTYPLSHMQEGMLFLDLRAPGSGVNTEQIICDLYEKKFSGQVTCLSQPPDDFSR